MPKKPKEIVIGRNGKRWWKLSSGKYEQIPTTHEDYKEVPENNPNPENMIDEKI